MVGGKLKTKSRIQFSPVGGGEISRVHSVSPKTNFRREMAQKE
jgi:hypothetical protein